MPLTYSNKQISELNSLPEAFNSFFSSIFCSMSLNCKLAIFSLMFVFHFFLIFILNSNDVHTALLKVKAKYNSSDGIPGFCFKVFAPFLFKPLIIILNEFFLSTKLPVNWKRAIITPLYKGKGDSNDITNYKFICCSFVTGKVFNSLMKHCVLSHLLPYSLLFNIQFGFLLG